MNTFDRIFVLVIILLLSVLAYQTYAGEFFFNLDPEIPDKPPIEEPLPPPVVEPPTTTYSDKYDHTNQRAFHTKYFASIFCHNTPRFDSCVLDGHVLSYHDLDEGRPLWTNRYRQDRKRGPLVGDLVCKKGATFWTFKITEERKQCGSCRKTPCL